MYEPQFVSIVQARDLEEEQQQHNAAYGQGRHSTLTKYVQQHDERQACRGNVPER